MREFPLGRCECGAVYVSETTGHNVGAAMVECLVNACGGNWDLAWDLLPEDDYLTGQLDDYDEVTHQVVPERFLDGRAVRGVLFFVRLHNPGFPEEDERYWLSDLLPTDVVTFLDGEK